MLSSGDAVLSVRQPCSIGGQVAPPPLPRGCPPNILRGVLSVYASRATLMRRIPSLGDRNVYGVSLQGL